MALKFNTDFINLGPLTSTNFGIEPINLSNVGPVAPLSDANLLASASRASTSPVLNVSALQTATPATTYEFDPTEFVGPVAPKATTTTTPSPLNTITLTPRTEQRDFTPAPLGSFETLKINPTLASKPITTFDPGEFVGPVAPDSPKPSPTTATDLTLTPSFLTQVQAEEDVRQAFNRVLGRQPFAGSGSGLEYWTNELVKGNVTLADLDQAIAFGAQGGDRLAANKFLGTNYFKVADPTTVPYASLLQPTTTVTDQPSVIETYNKKAQEREEQDKPLFNTWEGLPNIDETEIQMAKDAGYQSPGAYFLAKVESTDPSLSSWRESTRQEILGSKDLKDQYEDLYKPPIDRDAEETIYQELKRQYEVANENGFGYRHEDDLEAIWRREAGILAASGVKSIYDIGTRSVDRSSVIEVGSSRPNYQWMTEPSSTIQNVYKRGDDYYYESGDSEGPPERIKIDPARIIDVQEDVRKSYDAETGNESVYSAGFKIQVKDDPRTELVNKNTNDPVYDIELHNEWRDDPSAYNLMGRSGSDIVTIDPNRGFDRIHTNYGVRGAADLSFQMIPDGQGGEIPFILPIYRSTKTDLTPLVFLASAFLGPYAGTIGNALGFTGAAATAAGTAVISAGTQLVTTGKIDPLRTAVSAGFAYVGATGNLTGADIAEQATDLTLRGLGPAQVASTLESTGVNSVTANLASQFAAVGVPVELAPMLTAGVTNGSLLALDAISKEGDWSSAFRDGFLTGVSGEASAFAVNKLIGDDAIRELARVTNLTPAQINGIAAQSVSSAINAEVLNTGNFFDVLGTTAVSLGVSQSGANAIVQAFSDKLSPKEVAGMTSVARDVLTTGTAAVLNNRDPGAAVSANWVNIAVNAVSEVVRAPSQEAVDANRQSRIDAEVSKVETGELSGNPAAVEAYQNALGQGKTQTEAIDAAKRVVATERVDATAAGTTSTTEPVIIKDETGADVEVFKVPSWNIQEGKIDPKPMENVYRDANGNVYVNTVTEDGTSVTVSAPQFLSTALGIGVQSATELVSNFYNGVRLVGGASPDSAFSKMLDQINETGGKMESPEIQAGKADISRRLNEAEGFDIVTELFKSAIDNPSAAMSYVAIELPQELAVIGVAAKVSKAFGFLYGLGADAMMNAVDAGGADGKQAFDEAIKAGKSPEEAMDVAMDVFTTSAALSGVISPAIDFPFIKGAAKANVPTTGRTGAQIAKDVRDAGTATARESVDELGQSFTVAAVTDYLITGEVDWGDAFRQGATNSFYGAHTAGATSATISSINTSTGPVANNLSVVDPSNASSHLTMINDTLASSPSTSAAATTISTNLQNGGMPAAQADNIANTAIAESVVADVNANADGQFQIGDLNTAIGVDSNGDAVTLGDYLGSNYTNLGSTQVAINPSAVIGTDVDGTPLTIQNIQDLSTSITIDTSVTTNPNTGVVTETKTDVNPETNVVTETKTDVDPNTNTQTETKTDVDPETNVVTETKTDVDPNANTQTETKTDVDPNTNTVTETNTTTDPNTNVVTETETSTNIETDMQVVTRTETDPVTGGTTTTTEERKPDEEEKEEKEEKFRRLLQGSAAGATLLAATSPATSKILLPEETWLGGKPRVTPEMLDLFKIFAKDTPEMQEQEIFSALRRASGLEDSPGPRPLISEPSYYSYGAETTPGSVIRPFRRGGTVQNPISDDTMTGSPLARASGGDVGHKGTHYVQGAGGGQDDLIPAKLADGEYVFDAEIVAALGDGSNKEGAKILDKFREEIREHKRGGSTKTIPPKAKSPLAYLRSVT
jgi:hypothetical protein